MANRLAQSQSLYLRKHADNPIDWWPWCHEALTKARQENKPIFLSIGYSSCHWCTVMEGEAFSEPGIAAFMNANFIPIKVDREERPDLDSIYMQALQLITGQGGWPLNVFLAPEDLVPFFGGTYFSVQPAYGRQGFLEILQAIRHHYDTAPDKLQEAQDQILRYLRQSATLSPASTLSSTLLGRGLTTSTGILAGRGVGPSFPMIPYAIAALHNLRLTTDSQYDPRSICHQRGLDLALGGIYDHVGGGFHRYTVDGTWTVPHFEKMLYDNGQIMEYLAGLWSAGMQEPAFEQAIAGTVAWLQREMIAPGGYCYAAQDADSFITPEQREPEEGAFYVWDYPELTSLLDPAELTAVLEEFTVTAEGNFEGHNVLQRHQGGSLNSTIRSALDKLFAVRYGSAPRAIATFPPARNNQDAKTQPWPGRIPPVTDTKMIGAWNSLMISGLARAAAVFQEPSYLAIAARIAEFILAEQWVQGRFHRLNYDGEAVVLAQSEDYALFIKALLDLHQGSCVVAGSTQPAAWLGAAVKVQEEFDTFLWSVELGGYYNTAKDASQDLVLQERSYDDNATPAANGVAIANLVRLAVLTEDRTHLERAEQGLLAFHQVMERRPQSCPSLFVALDWYQNHTLVRTTPEILKQLAGQHLPTTVLQPEMDLPQGTVGLVCQGLTCREPAKSLEQLLDQVQQSQVRQQ